MYLLRVFVLVSCVYFCTVPARVAYLLVKFVLVLWLYHCTGWTVLVLISSHSCWTLSSLKGSAISFLGLGVEFVYQRFFFFLGNINIFINI